MDELPKWIYKSMLSSIKAILDTDNHNLYFDGMLPNAENPQEGLEIRFDGPHQWEISTDYWRYKVEVNVLIYHNIGTNLFRKHQMAGEVVQALKGPFAISNGVSTVGCMTADMGKRDGIRINHFGGPIRKDVSLEQSTVVASYTMYYEET